MTTTPTMRHLIALALVLLSPVATLAEGVSHVLILTKAGAVAVHDDGAIVRYQQVVDLRGTSTAPTPPPEPEPLPPPAPGSELVDKVRSWAIDANDPIGAQALAVVYSQAAEYVEDGAVTPLAGLDVLLGVSDAALGLTGTAKQWDEVREKLSTEITARLNRGELDSPEATSVMLRDIGTGLLRASDGHAEIDETIVFRITAVLQSAIGAADGK